MILVHFIKVNVKYMIQLILKEAQQQKFIRVNIICF